MRTTKQFTFISRRRSYRQIKKRKRGKDLNLKKHKMHSYIPPYFGTHETLFAMPTMSNVYLLKLAHCPSRKSISSDEQSCVLQEMYWIRCPVQYLPPFSGTGLLQSRVRYRTPPPHGRLHELLPLHWPQSPSFFVRADGSRCTHSPRWHQPLRYPCRLHVVPSAHGMCSVRQASESFPHHKRLHSGCIHNKMYIQIIFAANRTS